MIGPLFRVFRVSEKNIDFEILRNFRNLILFSGEAESSLAIDNTSVEGSKAKASANEAQAAVDAAAAPAAGEEITDIKAQRWFYLGATQL